MLYYSSQKILKSLPGLKFYVIERKNFPRRNGANPPNTNKPTNGLPNFPTIGHLNSSELPFPTAFSSTKACKFPFRYKARGTPPGRNTFRSLVNRSVPSNAAVRGV